MPHSLGLTLTKQKQAATPHQEKLPSPPCHYLSVKSKVGDALDDRVVLGPAGEVVPGGSRGTGGGGGGLLAGNTQKETFVPLLQSSSNEAAVLPRESG